MKNYSFRIIATDVLRDDLGESHFVEFEVNGVSYDYDVHFFKRDNKLIFKIVKDNSDIIARWTNHNRVDIMSADALIREVMREEFHMELPMKVAYLLHLLD